MSAFYVLKVRNKAKISCCYNVRIPKLEFKRCIQQRITLIAKVLASAKIVIFFKF